VGCNKTGLVAQARSSSKSACHSDGLKRILVRTRICLQIHEACINSNMRRLYIGLEVGVDPAEFCNLLEELDKGVLSKIEPHVVKLYGRDESGQDVNKFTGFIYTEEPLIFTTGHAINFGSRAAHDGLPEQCGAASFPATYNDGFSEEVEVVATPL